MWGKDTFRPPRGTKRCESTLNITRFGHQTLFFRSLLVALIANVREHVVSLQEQVISLHDHVERLTAVNEALAQRDRRP